MWWDHRVAQVIRLCVSHHEEAPAIVCWCWRSEVKLNTVMQHWAAMLLHTNGRTEVKSVWMWMWLSPSWRLLFSPVLPIECFCPSYYIVYSSINFSFITAHYTAQDVFIHLYWCIEAVFFCLWALLCSLLWNAVKTLNLSTMWRSLQARCMKCTLAIKLPYFAWWSPVSGQLLKLRLSSVSEDLDHDLDALLKTKGLIC